MSNYINVLRRLERERRTPEMLPEPRPVPVVPPPVVARGPLPSVEPVATPLSQTTTAVPVAATPRIVIPLPSVTPQPQLPPAPAPTPAMAAAPAPVVETPPIVARPAEHRLPDTRRTRAFATESHPGIATLLDKIRAIANGRESRTVVFCGASNAEAVGLLASTLASHATQTGMTAFLATLHRTGAGTTVLPAQSSISDALAVNLDDGSLSDTLSSWLRRVAPTTDLVIVTGPPLATSIDAALLACACDGLVIVAESEVTERAALQVAAERARIAGCNTLGVVMHGTKDRLPGWLRRLVGDRSESHAPRED